MAMQFLWSASISLIVVWLLVVNHVDQAMAAERDGRVLLEDNVYTIMSKLEKQEQELTALKTEMATLKAQQATQPGRVAFKTHLAKAFTPTANQLIEFDDIRFNVGNAYHNGVFIAPFNGTYLFSVTMCSAGGHYIVVDLLRNGNMIAQVLAGDDAYSDCSSETTVTELAVGDAVVVKHQGTHGDNIYADGTFHNAFTGVLLY